MLERMLAGVSTRQYRRTQEPVGEQVEAGARATSKSAASRMFVRRTAEQLGKLMCRPLSDLRLAVIMLDGIELHGRTCIVALGITTEGDKLALGLWDGSTENATVAAALLADLVDRGLDVEQGLLCVIDGSKGLRKAIRQVFGNDVPVQRCVQHKERNVLDHLPERDRPAVKTRLRRAWKETNHESALEQLTTLALELDHAHPGAAASLREGLEETLTVTRLGITGKLKLTLQSTNPCESMVRHEAPCERRERTNNSHPCRLEDRPRADAAARRSWGQSRRGIARWRREQPRQRSGRAALPDARVRASKTERQSESKAVVEAS